MEEEKQFNLDIENDIGDNEENYYEETKENPLERQMSMGTKLAYAELFQDEKTNWMGWEKQIIEQTTQASV